MINVHFSLLPRWRGAAPVERAILAGDKETGVCIMQLEAGLDTGPVYACRTIPITPDGTAGDLRRRLAELGTELLLSEIDSIPGRTPTPRRHRRPGRHPGEGAGRRPVRAGGIEGNGARYRRPGGGDRGPGADRGRRLLQPRPPRAAAVLRPRRARPGPGHRPRLRDAPP